MEKIKPFDTSELAAIKEQYSPYFVEIRKILYRTVVVLIIATIVGFAFYEQIIRILVGAFSLEGINIVFTSPFQFINLAISCGISVGLIIAIPFLVAQILYFLRPALKAKEFRVVTRYLPLSIILFLAGFMFGCIIMRWQIEIFLERSLSLGIGNVLDISGLLSTVFLTATLLGVAFQFPIILLLLIRIGIIKHEQLSKKRPWVYLGSFVFTLFLPPDSIIADIILTLPLIFLFELTLFLNKVTFKSK